MDEEIFTGDIRKFLRRVGVTAQQQIEEAVRAALANGTLREGAELQARMVLTIDAVGLRHEVEGTLHLG